MDKVEEGLKNLKTQQELTEDAAAGGGVSAAGAPATAAMGADGLATLGNTPGMGAPVLASRGVTGSGDVPSPGEDKKKKKKKKVFNFKEFLSNLSKK
jgi:hypothetical protein